VNDESRPKAAPTDAAKRHDGDATTDDRYGNARPIDWAIRRSLDAPPTWDEALDYARWLQRQSVAADDGGKRLGALSRMAALARIDAAPTEWLVEEVLASTDQAVLAGPKGVGKTLAMEDLAVSVALGEPWFGRFPTSPAVVLLLTCEDDEARTWRRLDAIARAKERDSTDLEDRVFVHPFPFSAIGDLAKLEAELDVVQPGLVVLDPAYRYLAGAKSSDLYDMGRVLTPLQVATRTRGSALMIGHHYNKNTGAAREQRVTGAGILEWSRVLITMEAAARRANDGGNVIASFKVTGNSVEPIAFRVRRLVSSLEDGPNPDLYYEAEVIAEGVGVPGDRASSGESATKRHILRVLNGEGHPLTRNQVVDRVVAWGLWTAGIQKSTFLREAGELVADEGYAVDGNNEGPRGAGMWWRTDVDPDFEAVPDA
jgi:hypothetical protein